MDGCKDDWVDAFGVVGMMSVDFNLVINVLE